MFPSTLPSIPAADSGDFKTLAAKRFIRLTDGEVGDFLCDGDFAEEMKGVMYECAHEGGCDVDLVSLDGSITLATYRITNVGDPTLGDEEGGVYTKLV